jgi:starch synthase
MEKKKVLIVTQELNPYTELSTISEHIAKLPQAIQSAGYDVRILMPRYGVVNERRHRLHEVVRLSGINIIIDDEDFPLIIKVASLPNSRIQIYFLDNDEFFKRKDIFSDNEGKFFEDNAERMAFFNKGAIETVKKFGWKPDIVHCHGWFSALMPCYLKTVYKNEPVFADANIIFSLYNHEKEESLGKSFLQKANLDGSVSDKDIEKYIGSDISGMYVGAMHFADAIIQSENELSDKVMQAFKKLKKNKLEHIENEKYLDQYVNFYKSVLPVEAQ